MSKRRKTDTSDPIPFQGEFSFVNKDAGNINSKDHNTAVSWHVLNRYEKWKKAERTRKANLSSSQPAAAEGSPSIDSSAFVAGGEPPQLRGESSTAGAEDYTSFATALGGSSLVPYSDYTDPTTLYSTTAVVSQSQTPGTSDPQALPSNVIVPAEANIGDLNTLDDQLLYWSPQQDPLFDVILSFVTDFNIPQTWPKDGRNQKHEYEKSKAIEDLSALQHNTAFTRAAMAGMTTILANVLDDENLHMQARWYANAAMLTVRQQLSEPSSTKDVQLFMAILHLFCNETALDNTSAARTHLKMLRKLVTENGGLVSLDPCFKENLLSCDCYFALKYETRPLFPVSEWSPGALGQPWKSQVFPSSSGRDRTNSLHPYFDHPILRNIIIDLRELFKVDHYVNHSDVAEDDPILRWKSLRQLDCVNRIADHHINLILFPHMHPQPKCQAAACVASALLTAMTISSPEPVIFGAKLSRDLKRRLLDALTESGEPTETDIFKDTFQLWILYIGTLAEKVFPIPSNELWFEDRYLQQLNKMKLNGSDEINSRLQQVLYSEDLHQEIQSGRERRKSETRKGVYSSTSASWREPIPSS